MGREPQHARIVCSPAGRLKRWLALAGLLGLRLLLVVSHVILLTVLLPAVALTAFVAFFDVLITGRPSPLWRFPEIWMRWELRAAAWTAGLIDEYPPFEGDPPGYDCDGEVPENEDPSRWWAAAGIVGMRLVAALPHLVVLLPVSVAAVATAWAGQAVVLVAGSLPSPWRRFLAGALQWRLRVHAWLFGLTDAYPRFSLALAPPATRSETVETGNGEETPDADDEEESDTGADGPGTEPG
jgi:hypothetical protein